ncbi:MAG: hypothetical protein RLN86_03655 [Cyclobacteriaceae bacterium]
MAEREKVNEIQIILNSAIFKVRELPEYFDNDKAEIAENIIENIKVVKKAVGLLRDEVELT